MYFELLNVKNKFYELIHPKPFYMFTDLFIEFEFYGIKRVHRFYIEMERTDLNISGEDAHIRIVNKHRNVADKLGWEPRRKYATARFSIGFCALETDSINDFHCCFSDEMSCSYKNTTEAPWSFSCPEHMRDKYSSDVASLMFV